MPSAEWITDRSREIRAEIRTMHETLDGCDWCCGGGDTRLRNLKSQLKKLRDAAR